MDEDMQAEAAAFMSEAYPVKVSPNEDVDNYEEEFVMENQQLNVAEPEIVASAFIEQAENPTKMCSNPSRLAQEFIRKLDQTRNAGDGEEMGNLVFDADCEGLASEIDLHWYEQHAAQLMQEE